MSLDIPDQVRKTVLADGNDSWLDELPGVVDSLAQRWSLMIESSFAGGHAALVAEVTLVDGTPAVLKIGVPGREVGQEAMALRLANGAGCAKLLGEDVSRGYSHRWLIARTARANSEFTRSRRQKILPTWIYVGVGDGERVTVSG